MNTLLILALLASAGEPPLVHYVAKAETRSWEPIAIAEVTRAVEAASLSELTKPGSMRLKKSSFSDLKNGEYTLIIQGRFVEEAERFSVYLTFGPGKQQDLPTFHTSDTSEPLGRKKRSTMEKLIQQTARRASKRMADVLGPRLESVRLRVPPPALEQPVLPVEWGAIEVPNVAKKSKSIRDLLKVRNPDHVRFKAMAAIKGHAFDQQPARNALERCVLLDPNPRLRVDCIRALEPVSRTHVPTQRILLHALRTSVDENVLTQLAKVSQSFVGLARTETISTWLHLVASEATPERAAERIARLLAKEGDVANLDFAVAKCLQMESLPTGKKSACATLLKNIPMERRIPVVWRYLSEPNIYSTGERMTYESVLKSVMGSRNKPTNKAVLDLLLDLSERKSMGRLRYKVIYEAGRKCEPTPKTVERLMRLAYDVETSEDAIRAATAVASRDPALIGMTIGALERLRKEVHWTPGPRRSEPYRPIEKALKRLRRKQKK